MGVKIGQPRNVSIEITRILGIAASILITIMILYIIQNYDFKIFEFINHDVEYVKASAGIIGSEVTKFLWTRRIIDLMLQAILLFTTILCCVAMLRSEEG